MSITLSTIPAFATAVAHARTIDFAAYTLRAGTVRDALIVATRDGAHVRVRLAADPLDDAVGSLHAANAESIGLLQAAGADAAATSPTAPVLHLKAAVVDGVAWLDDRNWAGEGPETVLRDSDPDDVATVSQGLATGSGSDGHLAMTKAGAQYIEADLIRAAGSVPVAVESESFGSGTIYNVLLARGRAGRPTRLLVAGGEAADPGKSGDIERRRLARLASLGIAVRTGQSGGIDFDEKLALAGSAAWVGSANATYARGDAGKQRDWGLMTRDPPLTAALQGAFERNWAAASPLAPKRR